MKAFTIKKSVLTVCLCLLVYYAIMELYYWHFIGIEYTMYRFRIDFDMYKYVETKIYFFVILFLTMCTARVSPFIYCVLVFFVIFFFVPNLITYSFGNQIAAPLYSNLILLFGMIGTAYLNIRTPYIQLPAMSYGLILLIILILIIPFINEFGLYFNVQNLLLNDVYSTREIFNETSSRSINYLYPWLVKATLPLLLIFFLIKKRWFPALVCLLMLFYLYIISGNKLVYITIFVMLFFYYVGEDFLDKVKYFCILLLVGLSLIPVVDFYFFSGDSNLKGTFVMRMLFLPSQLNYLYFDFFHNDPLFFAESNFFKWFVSYPYDKPIGYVISETYFNAPDMNSNNGIISDGYMNLGYPGIALNILLVCSIFLFFKSLNPDPRYLGIFFVMVFLLLSVPMLSMFITSGLWIIAIMALTIMKRDATFMTR